MQEKYEIRMAYPDDWEYAMDVTWKTFLEFEGDVYPPAGVKSFQDFIMDRTLYNMFLKGEYQMFCAFDTTQIEGSRERLIGMITLRNITHISLLFVDKRYHRQGVGRNLIERVRDYLLSELGQERMTVNASPYGVEFYHKIGFQDLGPETMQDGIVYTPMELYL